MKEIIWQKKSAVFIGAWICCMLWGSAFPCVKIGYQLFGIAASDTATQILFAGMRFTLAGLLVICFESIRQRKMIFPRKQALLPVLELCMMQTVLQYLFFYIGLARTSGVKASIIEGMNVFVVIFISSLLLRQERLEARKLIGSFVGFAGVVLINLGGSTESMALNMGDVFIALSTVAYAFSSAWMKKVTQKEDPVMLSGYQFMMGGILLAACGWIGGGRISIRSGQAVGMLFYLALVSAVAYTLWGIMLKYNPVSRVAVYGFMNPVCGVFLSAILLKETKQALCLKSLLALILVSIGIYIAQSQKKGTMHGELECDNGKK